MSHLIDGLAMLFESGITLTPDGDSLLWEADRDLTGSEISWITAHKKDILRELTVVRLDFETESPLDIKLGIQAYLRDLATKVLMLAWSVGLGDVHVWWPGKPMPEELRSAIAAGSLVVSHGAFDRYVWAARMVKQGWPMVPDERWSDTSARCRAYRVPAELKKAAMRLELEARKDPEGRRLIRRATEAARGGKPLTVEELAKFEAYVRRDLEVLRELDRAVRELSAEDRAPYELNELMNARGFPIDRVLVSRLWALWQAEDARLTDQMVALSGLRPGQNVRLKEWLQAHAAAAPKNLEAETLAAWLSANPHANASARQVVQLRLEAANSSGSKLKTLLACTTEADPFARGALLWHGAHTGRWAGRVFQPQNFPRIPEDMDVMTVLADLLNASGPTRSGAIPGMERCKPNVNRSVKARIAYCLRAVIQALKGQHLVVADFAQIESRVLCWLAGQDDKLDAYRRKVDVYVITANALGSKDRNLGKLMTLAAGFGGGARMLLAKAPSYEVSLTEYDAPRYIEGWREDNTAITAFWRRLYDTVRDVVESPAGTTRTLGNMYPQNLIVISHEGDDTLRITLPSGRQLIYHQPRIVRNGEFEWSFDLVYQQNGPGDWIEKRSWHGLLTENVVQAIAYDLMVDAMLRMHQAGIHLIGTVHDEAIALAADPQAEVILQQMLAIMRAPPDWANDLPLAAEGYHHTRYLKPPKPRTEG
jgi:DNA polymerase